jgi:hypothetical protein
MKLYIYKLEKCKTCTQRQPIHNKLADYMSQMGAEVIGVRYGMIEGKRVEPLAEHDQLCRKADDPMKYTAPVYILEVGDAVVRLPDLGSYPSVEEYVDDIVKILNDISAAQ